MDSNGLDNTGAPRATSNGGKSSRPKRLSASLPIRTPMTYKVCDWITEWLLYAMIVFSPWAFGTTQVWSTWVMNCAGYVMGAVLVTKWLVMWKTGYRPSRWDTGRSMPRTLLTRTLAVLTVVILLYCLISALNARADYKSEKLAFDYYDNYITWLPHSYDYTSSWYYFFTYLGLGLTFWAVRDWLLGKTANERRRSRMHGHGGIAENEETSSPARGSRFFLPVRLRRLLWVLSINCALLGVEGTFQRLEGSGNLLFLVKPRINKNAEAQFGPYAYRSNAAQYFNLVWPVALGFWWLLGKADTKSGVKRRIGEGPQSVLLPAIVIMASAPIISTSRGGAIVAACLLLAATILLIIANKKGHWVVKLGIVGLFCSIIAFAGYLGWERLKPRLEKIFDTGMSGRSEIYENSLPMARDFPVWGSGPGSFGALYQLYRSDPDQTWEAQLHCDWLETRITFGWVGTLLILIALAAAIAHIYTGGGMPSVWPFYSMIFLALAGCLVHAIADFPFQIHSILFMFLLLSCMCTCLSRVSME
ncbi:MAG: O-antigen ligase family protein [Verrucomicrobia bacterium]|nr:O-antigen ligase family protein [Verrucomicrobiota bacterium]MCF7709085.1 O-antigen ligase family protein [Verrucomicrobiota bacterium]